VHASKLEAAGSSHAKNMTKTAVAAGDWLLSMGVSDGANGMKWPLGADSDGAHDGVFFPNCCCGTAGVAYTLATLHCEVPGDQIFLAAALGGAEHLTSVANVTKSGRMLLYHDAPAHEHLYYFGWCHGPSGTSRLWARLHQITGDLSFWEKILKGLEAVSAHALPHFDWLTQPAPEAAPWANVGQCCGGAAGLNFALQAYEYGTKQSLSFGHYVCSTARCWAEGRRRAAALDGQTSRGWIEERRKNTALDLRLGVLLE